MTSDSESEPDVSDSEADSDAEQVQMCLEDEEVSVAKAESTKAFLEKGLDNGSSAKFPEGGILINIITNTAHQLRDAHTTACGICAPATKFTFYYEQSAILGANLCWRSGCAKWERDDADDSSESSSS